MYRNPESQTAGGNTVEDAMDNCDILVVDDDPGVLELIKAVLSREGFRCSCFLTGRDALLNLNLNAAPPILAILDLHLPDYSGATLIQKLRASGFSAPIVVMTARASVNDAVEVMKLGAFDFLPKPFEPLAALVQSAKQAIRHHRLQNEKRELEEKLAVSRGRTNLIGGSLLMQQVREMVRVVASTSATVLITGETGTGKELVARLVHEMSPRHSNRFVPINCGELTSSLLESELFGHAKGAFTGANAARPGLFVSADGGTIFLDEVAELEMPMQTRLLRVLEDSEVRPVGSDKTKHVDTRIVAATHRRLETMVENGSFREDLYYRLKVFGIRIPPLRERRGDIVDIAKFLVRKHAVLLNRDVPSVSDSAYQILQQYDWPGNVRQLEHVLERALILCGQCIDPSHLSIGTMSIPPPSSGEPSVMSQGPTSSYREARVAFEKNYLESVLEHAQGNRAEAARLAQLDPSNLRRLLRKHQML